MNFKNKAFLIIFGTETRSGRLFDVVLMVAIILSVIVVMFDSVASIHDSQGEILFIAEWVFTVVFSIEYILRIYTSPNRLKYILSFYGLIDLLAILPTYLSLFLTGGQYLIIIRILRLLRVFRILKLYRFIGASRHLVDALRESRHKIAVFLSAVMAIVVVMGAAMYLIEGPENGYSSIPESIYWAIITLTTVGYGDITPATPLGKALASIVMILGYSIIAVPTGIITSEMAKKTRSGNQPDNKCAHCGKEDHDRDAEFCNICGNKLSPNQTAGGQQQRL